MRRGGTVDKRLEQNNAMKERPILFSAPMVLALLEGRKTQTRRIVRLQPCVGGIMRNLSPGIACRQISLTTPGTVGRLGFLPYGDAQFEDVFSPYGQPGDRLIVKENAWMWCESVIDGKTKTGRDKIRYIPFRHAHIFYCADHPEKPSVGVVSEYRGYQWGWHKKIGRFVPRWASRITLEITSVRVERLQDISENDARAEGITEAKFAIGVAQESVGGKNYSVPYSIRGGYCCLWNDINRGTQYMWAHNPWVWVIEFKRITP